MKKILLAILGLTAFATAHAQQTVIVQKTPGLLEGIVDAAVAVATAPVVFGTAIVSGVEEVFAPAVVGRTHVTVLPQPAVVVSPVPPPAVIAPQVVSPEWLAEDIQQWLQAAINRYRTAGKQEISDEK